MAKQIIRPFVDADMLRANMVCYEEIDLTALPHALVTGVTGSGKTVLVKVIIFQILTFFADVKIWLCDFKHDDFIFLENSPRYFSHDDCTRGIDDFYKAFEARQSGEDKSRTMNWLIFDEVAAFLSASDKKTSEESKKKLATLAMLGRSYNFHLMVIMQRGDAKHLDGFRDQFSLILTFGNMSAIAAHMYGYNKEKLRPVFGAGAGHMLVHGARQQAIQVPRVSDMSKLDAAIQRRFMIQN